MVAPPRPFGPLTGRPAGKGGQGRGRPSGSHRKSKRPGRFDFRYRPALQGTMNSLRLPASALALVLLFAAAHGPAFAEPIEVDARTVPLNEEVPEQTTVGALRYRGGLSLTSPDPRFGGLSALAVAVDGQQFLALSDRGFRFTARLVYDEKGDLAGVRGAELATISGLDGRPLSGVREADAESLAPGAEGEIIVAFERWHRLWRYFPGVAVPEPLPPPIELEKAPRNGGIEALTMLDDASLLALTEKYGAGDAVVGWISDEEGWSVLTYATRDGFSPTGAATLPGGDVVVVERRFTLRGGVAVRLVRIDSATIRPGARLEGRVLAEIRPPLTVDNFEGVDARRGPDGETLIYVVSDDNYNPAQRTLLLMFELRE